MRESSKHIYILKSDEGIGHRLKYTLDFINGHPHFQDSMIALQETGLSGKTIHYTKNGVTDSVWIYRQHQFYNISSGKESLFANSYRHQNQLFHSVESVKHPEKTLNNHAISFDIFESIFFHISRYEEWFCTDDDLNEWDALKEDQHFLIAHNLHRQPVVDHLILLLRSILQLPSKPIETKIVLTHDIDYLKKYTSKFQIFRKIAGHLRRGERLAHLPRLVKDYYRSTWKGGNDPYQNLEWLLDQKYPGEKYLFLIVGGEHTFDPPHKSDDAVRKVVQLAAAHEYTIGLHPSYLTYRDGELLAEEYDRLGKSVGHSLVNSRQHYLHFDFRRTPRHLIDVGIKHDFSMGYNRHVGFRCGTAFPYSYYSFDEEKALDLTCHPLAFMDSSCFHEAGRDGAKFKQIFYAFFQANGESGILNVNFHNQFFDTASYYDIPLAEMYEKLLRDFS